VFAGALNEVMRLFHDEEVARAAALAALQRAVASGRVEQVSETFFDVPVHYRDFAEFEQRMIGVTYLDHRLDDSTLAAVRARFEPHMTADGAHFRAADPGQPFAEAALRLFFPRRIDILCYRRK
jgi:hypothetical protein